MDIAEKRDLVPVFTYLFNSPVTQLYFNWAINLV